MGQYKLWLHYREVDQQLHAQLVQLTADLDALKQQTQDVPEDLSALSDNPILRALLAQLTPSPSATPPLPQSTTTVLEDATRQNIEEVGVPVSHALHALTSLPNFDSQLLPVPLMLSTSERSIETVYSVSPHPELDLLPEDLTTFVDEHTQTAPIRTLPWWLRNSPDILKQEGQLFDQQSERTNHLVERWLERWGRHPNTQEREGQK
jgi:hypothetical protein